MHTDFVTLRRRLWIWRGVAVVAAGSALGAEAGPLRLEVSPDSRAESLVLRITTSAAEPLTPERLARIEVIAAETLPVPAAGWRVVDGEREFSGGVLRVTYPAKPAVAPQFFAAREATTAPPVVVRDAAGFRTAVTGARPGATILLAPGTYPGGFHFRDLQGTADAPIVIAGQDPGNPPVLQGGSNGIQLTDPAHLELRDLVLRGATGNGLNIDDGGTFESPARHLALRRLRVQDIGPEGNRDGIKLSGVVSFTVENCLVERWGSGGSAIDMVGCHQGLIVSNVFLHTEAVAAASGTGVQAKGGSREVTVRRNRFEFAGSRAVNIGGSTGLEFFRPPLEPTGDRWEAKDILVEGNTFLGSLSPIAFVGVDGAVVRFNTVYRPQRWAVRILQETTAPGFVACRNGRFTDNVVAFLSSQWGSGGVNVGANTAPDSFEFARNWWYCIDAPARSRPTLPGAETGGVYGAALEFRDTANGDLHLVESSPARVAGADGLP